MRIILMPKAVLLLAVLHWLTWTEFALGGIGSSGLYSLLNNSLICISSAFVESYSYITRFTYCAFMCDQNLRCQAFATSDGPCQLFVFDKCSKSVRDCNCTRRGQVFVKQQSGLLPGALCPSNYTDDLCGVKYKMYTSTGNWSASRQKCESESGLVIMTDVIDTMEMSQVDMLYDKYSIGTFWLGGLQAPGSEEPAGGWYWVACNMTVASNLWGANEPNNTKGDEDVIGRWNDHPMLSDFRENSTTPKGVLCECVSPFN